MKEHTPALDDRQSLEQVLETRGVPTRDCRDCSKFQPDEQGRGFGYCTAHRFYVKLYQNETPWHSQCQFKAIRLVRELREDLPVSDVAV
jgi:hypothetical protein